VRDTLPTGAQDIYNRASANSGFGASPTSVTTAIAVYCGDSDSDGSSSSSTSSSSSRAHSRRRTAIDGDAADDVVWEDTATATAQQLALTAPQLSPLYYSNTHSLAAVSDEQHSARPS
jgi:hypothetical protein